MKRIFFAVVISIAFTLGIKAQQATNDDLEIIQSVFGKSKKQLVESYMGLDNESAAKFWPIYNQFETERKGQVKDRLSNISNYVGNYTNLTDDSAKGLMKQAFKNELNTTKLHKKYFKKMEKAVGALNATKFMQMETYLQKAIDMEVLNKIPFIGELGNSKM